MQLGFAIAVPRDRAGTFDPQWIAKYQRQFPGFAAKIVAMYARGMSVREIQGHLQEIYAIDVPPDLISTITDVVLPFGRLRRGWRMAEPAAGAGLCHRLLSLPKGSIVCGLGSATRERFATRRFILPLAFGRTGPRKSSACGLNNGKAQVLVARHEGAEEPRRQ
jgi:putative transposase